MQKTLVSDYDNTLYVNDNQILQNVDKIKEFINNGNIFVIATGRSYIDVSKMIVKYNIQYNYLICNDGGTIFDNNGKLLYKKDIQIDVANKIMEYIIQNNLYDITYIDSGFDYTKNIENCVNAIIIKDIDTNKSKKILNDITTKFNSVHGYISDNWINITEESVTKSNGIKFLENKLNLKEIYTIGDNINDIDMILKYNGACMKNSVNDLKNICSKQFDSIKDFIEYIN